MTGTIRLEGVYKIFGEQPRGRALELARTGHSKTEIQAWTDHVVGLADVNVDIRQGELFVIMGLSGSGKSTA
ncbi:MAG: glycine betaine/L-proline ABC transporter ATP-binding protein, partial [Actinomycetota bacterium]|nr:glycine betaine/L-proline ABC transporter ATP-binding protein [Actinomycetota bacterium]